MDELAKAEVRAFRRLLAGKIPVIVFRDEYARFWKRDRSDEEKNDARLSRGLLKKIMDEVVPVHQFLEYRDTKTGFVKFSLNNSVPDCVLWRSNTGKAVGVEVTIARGHERYFLQRELVETGWGRGFVGLLDGSPGQEFEIALSADRQAYGTDEVLDIVQKGICQCIKRKNEDKFQEMILLIGEKLNLLPKERWTKIVPSLRSLSAHSPFKEIYLVGQADNGSLAFRLK
jgi:hypothetical protein